MKRILALLLVAVAPGVAPQPGMAHCGAGQNCEYAPWHHCPNNQPCGDLGSAVTTMNNAAEAISKGKGSGIVRIYKKNTELAPLGPGPVIPPLARPPGAAPAPLPGSGIPGVGPAGPVAVPAQPDQSEPVASQEITPQQLQDIPRGVVSATRDMLSVRAADKIAAQTGGTAQAELLQVHAMKLGQNFEALKRYNKLMQQAEHLSRTGDLGVKPVPDIWTDLEKVRAFTQGVVDTRESPAR